MFPPSVMQYICHSHHELKYIVCFNKHTKSSDTDMIDRQTDRAKWQSECRNIYTYLPFCSILQHTISVSAFDLHCWILSTVSMFTSSSTEIHFTVLHFMLALTSFSPFCRMQWLKIAFKREREKKRTNDNRVQYNDGSYKSKKKRVQSFKFNPFVYTYCTNTRILSITIPNRWMWVNVRNPEKSNKR